MHSSLARSTAVTITCILTGALLVGCASTESVPGVALGASQTNPFGSANLGPAHKIGNEILNSYHVTTSCTDGNHRAGFSINGTAIGPYPGTFNASGYFIINNYGRMLWFQETFAITSGANTVSGSITWDGLKRPIAGCQAGRGISLGAGKGFDYTATITQGTKTKTFSGPASESGINNAHFGETLI
jgi:hypothetical protein